MGKFSFVSLSARIRIQEPPDFRCILPDQAVIGFWRRLTGSTAHTSGLVEVVIVSIYPQSTRNNKRCTQCVFSGWLNSRLPVGESNVCDCLFYFEVHELSAKLRILKYDSE